MTIEECYERVQERKRRIRSITVGEAYASNRLYEDLGGFKVDVLRLDKEQERLSEMILNMQ